MYLSEALVKLRGFEAGTLFHLEFFLLHCGRNTFPSITSPFKRSTVISANEHLILLV